MIKNRLSLDNLGVQLEIKDKGLYVSFYLDADYGTKPICSILMDDLISDYNTSFTYSSSTEDKESKHFIKMLDLMSALMFIVGKYRQSHTLGYEVCEII